ncbi:hypothetical protein VNI00_017279 [Paramarasmius palmivorus]|uniref:Helicase ATP-binding domain-containing protein n=1 Tax=Paramarasmius palmivorus TaxID=297713 RepID=A0AAW0B6Q7_9AGAR
MATGEGKSAFFCVPIAVHNEVSKNPELYEGLACRKDAVGIVVTPTKGLADSIILELERFGISGLSYCHEVITKLRTEHVDFVQKICECKTWQVICVDPEHLQDEEWSKIIKHETFSKNLIYFCNEEAHLNKIWGTRFRPAFRSIGSFARGHLPDTVPVIALSATCAPGKDTAAICNSLGLTGDHFHLVRRSNERQNMHIVIEPFKRRPGVSKYAQLMPYLTSKRKTIIHVENIAEGYDIYEFLWGLIPENVNKLRRMRMFNSILMDSYNRETIALIDSDDALQVVIATIGFANGINCRRLLDSISVGMPDLDTFWQQKGRCRPGELIVRGVAIVSPKVIKTAEDMLKVQSATGSVTFTATKSKKKTKNTRKGSEECSQAMDDGKMKILTEKTCYTRMINVYYHNPPTDITALDCHEAKRAVYCKLCAERHQQTYQFLAPPRPMISHSDTELDWLPVPEPIKALPKPRKSKTNLGVSERRSMHHFLEDIQTRVWRMSLDSSNNITLSYFPKEVFFPESLMTLILDKFLVIKTLDDLVSILKTHYSWRYTEPFVDLLLRNILSYQIIVYERREEEKQMRDEEKALKKRARRTPTPDNDIPMVPELPSSPSPLERPRTPLMPRHVNHETVPKQVTKPRRQRAPQQSMKDAVAEYGPKRTVNRRPRYVFI